MLDCLPIEIFKIIVEMLDCDDHVNLSVIFPNIYDIINKIRFYGESTASVYSRYKRLDTIFFRNALPKKHDSKSFKLHSTLKYISIDFSPAYTRRYTHKVDIHAFFLWISNLNLTMFSCNTQVPSNILFKILGNHHLKIAHYPFLCKDSLSYISPNIQEISVLVFPTNQNLDLGHFKNLKIISVFGSLSPIVLSSLMSISGIKEIKLILCGINCDIKELYKLPITHIDLNICNDKINDKICEELGNLKQLQTIVFRFGTDVNNFYHHFKPHIRYKISGYTFFEYEITKHPNSEYEYISDLPSEDPYY